MPTQLDLICALDEHWLRDDVVWLAKRITWRELDETEEWLGRIEIPTKFFRILTDAQRGIPDRTIPVTVESHDSICYASPKLVRSKAFLEWDVEGATTSSDGICGAFAIFAAIPYGEDHRLWCWICETIAEEEHAEGMFSMWAPPASAYIRVGAGVPQPIAH